MISLRKLSTRQIVKLGIRPSEVVRSILEMKCQPRLLPKCTSYFCVLEALSDTGLNGLLVLIGWNGVLFLISTLQWTRAWDWTRLQGWKNEDFISCLRIQPPFICLRYHVCNAKKDVCDSRFARSSGSEWKAAVFACYYQGKNPPLIADTLK